MTMETLTSSPNQVTPHSPMDDHSHASTMDHSAIMTTAVNVAESKEFWPPPPPVSEDDQVVGEVDETTVYETASTDSSEVEEMSIKEEDQEKEEDESPVRKAPEEPSKAPKQEQSLQAESSHSSYFPVISLHDSQHSIVSGLTAFDRSAHKSGSGDKVDRLREELSMLKLNVLKDGHHFSKEEIVNVLDKIQEDLCGGGGGKPSSQLSVISSDGEDSSIAGSEYGDDSSSKRRKKSKSLPPVERGRKKPRKPKKNKSRDVPPSPKTPRSSISKRGKRSSEGSSRRKQRTIKAQSERSSRSLPVEDGFNSEALRKILKGEGTSKMSTLREERSTDTRSTKSSTKSKGRSSSLNPKSRSNSIAAPKMGRKPPDAVAADFSGQLNDTQGLKKGKAPRRKSAPMMGADFDHLAVLQQAAIFKTELNDVEQQQEPRRRERKQKGKAPRRQSAPMMGADFDVFAARFQEEKQQQKEQRASGDDKTRSSTESASIAGSSVNTDNESAATNKKKKKSKKIKSSRRRTMSAVYTDQSGQLNPIDLSARTEGEDSSVGSFTRKKKKSRKPKNRHASMEVLPSNLSQPVKLERHQTFDSVISRLQQQQQTQETSVTPKQSRRASISDFTKFSEHMTVDSLEEEKTNNDNRNELNIYHSPKKEDPEASDDMSSRVLEDESDSPVPPVTRSKLAQAKRKSTQFFSKVGSAASIITSPRSARRKKKTSLGKSSLTIPGLNGLNSA
ncbi:unnamed protein product [Cylindrotheca closterium]|uniref:Uncharacterized protein n=1 Tax=Cylindrotheca closterium TaxID=2856 RepID=A0AAD2G8V6_9STRA|nr:unnamed protein product [Cylindrotheca closterium]